MQQSWDMSQRRNLEVPELFCKASGDDMKNGLEVLYVSIANLSIPATYTKA